MLEYRFPYINNIDVVLPHIEGRNEFSVSDKGEFVIINYMVAFEDTFAWDDNDPIGSSIRRECRGLAFDKRSGEIISRPYHKFFNVNEKAETSINKINLYEPHIILEKLDGSMVRPIPINMRSKFILATKAGPTEVSEQAEQFIADKPNYKEFIRRCINLRLTPIFEWCSRKNRIVIDHPTDRLILTAIRFNEIGDYLRHDLCAASAADNDIESVWTVKSVLSEQNIQLLVDQVREWEGSEGIVLRFASGHMVKVKADQYITLHKVKELFSQEKSIIKVVVEDNVDDLVPLLDDSDLKRIRDFQRAFWFQVDEVAGHLAAMFISARDNYDNRKDFAIEFVQKLPVHYRPFMFAMYSRPRGAKQLLIEYISKNLSTQRSVDSARWAWGGLNWNYDG